MINEVLGIMIEVSIGDCEYKEEDAAKTEIEKAIRALFLTQPTLEIEEIDFDGADYLDDGLEEEGGSSND